MLSKLISVAIYQKIVFCGYLANVCLAKFQSKEIFFFIFRIGQEMLTYLLGQKKITIVLLINSDFLKNLYVTTSHSISVYI